MSQQDPMTLSKDSIEKALKLYTEAEKTKKKRKRSKDESDELNKYSLYCNPILGTSNKKSTAQTFSPTFALNEMRLSLMKHDWVNLQRLFPLILQLPSTKETLVWRYALTILLHSPMSSETNLKEFFNMCIGCPEENFRKALADLISLENNENLNKTTKVKTPRRKSVKPKETQDI